MCYVIVPYQSIDREVNQIVTNEAMIHHIYLCNLSLTRHTAEKETGEGATEHAPGNQIITGKFVLGGGFCSVFSEPLGWGGGLNVTLALICHIGSQRYEENASRLNVQLRHK